MTTISDIGERSVIEIILKKLDKLPNMAIPFGDDVAAVPINDKLLAVLKTDMLVARTDIPLGMSLKQAARKAIVMNVSDLSAKGVKPIAFLVSLGLPRNLTKKDILEIAKGLNAGAKEYGAYVIGGDTGEALDLIICCMTFGLSKRGALITRSDARPGDIVAVTGGFGKTALGLKLLYEKFKLPLNIRKAVLEAVYMPRARLNEGLALAQYNVATASIDSSDGLAISLHELRKMSNVGFRIDHVPIASEVIKSAKILQVNSYDLALYGGEEYELVVTIKRNCWKKAQHVIMEAGGTLIRIGEVTEHEDIVLMKDERDELIPYKGWEHFKTTYNFREM